MRGVDGRFPKGFDALLAVAVIEISVQSFFFSSLNPTRMLPAILNHLLDNAVDVIHGKFRINRETEDRPGQFLSDGKISSLVA